jgi:hypothetical protein
MHFPSIFYKATYENGEFPDVTSTIFCSKNILL